MDNKTMNRTSLEYWSTVNKLLIADCRVFNPPRVNRSGFQVNSCSRNFLGFDRSTGWNRGAIIRGKSATLRQCMAAFALTHFPFPQNGNFRFTEFEFVSGTTRAEKRKFPSLARNLGVFRIITIPYPKDYQGISNFNNLDIFVWKFLEM